MQVVCTNCGKDVPAANINIDKLVAKCDACQAVFPFDVAAAAGGGMATPSGLPAPPTPMAADEVEMPAGMSVQLQGNDLVIVRSWWGRAAAKYMLLFGLIWNGATWYVLMGLIEAEKWPIVGFFSILALIGLVIAYVAAGTLVNSTTIRVGRESLATRHGPLPFPGNITLQLADVARIYADQKSYQERGSDDIRTSSVSYVVKADLLGGGTKLVLGSVPESAPALFVAQEINKHVSIGVAPGRSGY